MVRGRNGPTESPMRISFQGSSAMRLLHDEAKTRGHSLTDLYAAGLLLVLEDREARVHALKRMRKWQVDFRDAKLAEIRTFLESVEAEE